MFRNRLRASTMFLGAIHITALLALCLGGASNASAAKVIRLGEGDGYHVYFYINDKGKVTSMHVYGPNNEHIESTWFDSDPNPEGDGTGGGAVDTDAIKSALDMAKKFGSPYHVQEDPWKHLFGHTSWANNKGPSVTDPWKGSPWYDDPAGGGAGGGGSFDPNVPLGDQLPSQPGKSSDDDDGDGGRRPDPADAQDFNPDPTVIDPPRLSEGGSELFSSALTDAGKSNGAGPKGGFVLLSPSTQGVRPGALKTSMHGLDPQPIPWATFGGAQGAFQRPGTVAGQGLR